MMRDKAGCASGEEQSRLWPLRWQARPAGGACGIRPRTWAGIDWRGCGCGCIPVPTPARGSVRRRGCSLAPAFSDL